MTGKRKPNFFIVGAPKCGTTAMWRYLSSHPDVHMTTPKEPHYFNTDHQNRTVRDWSDYLALFEEAHPGVKILGEASVWYLYSKRALQEIRRTIPDARILVMIRNPVDMVPSLHEQLCLSGREDVLDLESAWRLQDQRARGERLPDNCVDPSHLQYKDVCSLGTLLNRVYEVMPEEQVLVTLFDDLREDPLREYTRVLKFLGLPNDGKQTFEIVNQGRRVHSWHLHRALQEVKKWIGRSGLSFGTGFVGRVERANTVRRQRGGVSARFRAELQHAFKGEIELLERRLQRDLSEWCLPAPGWGSGGIQVERG